MVYSFYIILQEALWNCQTWKQWHQSRRWNFPSDWLAFQWRRDLGILWIKSRNSCLHWSLKQQQQQKDKEENGKWGEEIKLKIPSAAGMWLYVVGIITLGLLYIMVMYVLLMLRYLDGQMFAEMLKKSHLLSISSVLLTGRTHSRDVKQHCFCIPWIYSIRGGSSFIFCLAL